MSIPDLDFAAWTGLSLSTNKYKDIYSLWSPSVWEPADSSPGHHVTRGGITRAQNPPAGFWSSIYLAESRSWPACLGGCRRWTEQWSRPPAGTEYAEDWTVYAMTGRNKRGGEGEEGFEVKRQVYFWFGAFRLKRPDFHITWQVSNEFL